MSQAAAKHGAHVSDELAALQARAKQLESDHEVATTLSEKWQQAAEQRAQQLQSAQAEVAAAQAQLASAQDAQTALQKRLDRAVGDLYAARALACAPPVQAPVDATPSFAPRVAPAVTTGRMHTSQGGWPFGGRLSAASSAESPAALRRELAHCKQELARAQGAAAAKQEALQAMWSLCRDAEAHNAAVLADVHRASCTGIAAEGRPSLAPGHSSSFNSSSPQSPAMFASARHSPDTLAQGTIKQLQGLLASTKQRAASAEAECAQLHVRVSAAETQLEDASRALHLAQASCQELQRAKSSLQRRLDNIEGTEKVQSAGRDHKADILAIQEAVRRAEQAEGLAQAREEAAAALSVQLDAERSAVADSAAEAKQLRQWLEAQRQELTALQHLAGLPATIDTPGSSANAGQCADTSICDPAADGGTLTAQTEGLLAYQRQLQAEMHVATKEHEV